MPFSKLSDDRLKVASSLPREAFRFNPFAHRANILRVLRRKRNCVVEGGKREEGGRERPRSVGEERVNYIFVLPISGEPSARLLSSYPLEIGGSGGAREANNAVTLSRARSTVRFELKRRRPHREAIPTRNDIQRRDNFQFLTRYN